MNKELFLQEFKKLDLKGKNATQLYNEISSLAMKYIQASEKPNRSASYLSIEFLIGRVFYNNLLELGVLQGSIGDPQRKGRKHRPFRGNRRRGSRQRRFGAGLPPAIWIRAQRSGFRCTVTVSVINTGCSVKSLRTVFRKKSPTIGRDSAIRGAYGKRKKSKSFILRIWKSMPFLTICLLSENA